MIRPATVWDAAIVTKMWASMIGELGIPHKSSDLTEQEKFLLSLIVKIKSETHTVIVSEIGDEIVGFLTGFIYVNEYGGKDPICSCDNIFIKKAYRTRGLKEEMVDWIINFGRSFECKTVEFQVRYDEALVKAWGRSDGCIPTQATLVKEID